MDTFVEMFIAATVANIVGFRFVLDDDLSIYTGEFMDVQWNPPNTLYLSQARSMHGSALHEVGHILTSSPEELASENYEGGTRKRNQQEMDACMVQTYVLWRYRDLFTNAYVDNLVSDYGLDDPRDVEEGQSYWVSEAVDRVFNHPEMERAIAAMREAKRQLEAT